MEAFVEQIKRLAADLATAAVPYLRQALRFLALPYCYFFQVDWSECTRSRLQAAGDLLHIFFRHGYYPDNYGFCRLYEQNRSMWRFYFGSGYNPFQKARLARNLQPPRFHVLFEDKEIWHQLCSGLGLPVPRQLGVLDPTQELADLLDGVAAASVPERLILKPVSGLGGAEICLAEREGEGWRYVSAKGRALDGLPARRERYVVQQLIEQHPDVAALNPSSVNTMRLVTMLKRDGGTLIVGNTIRVGAHGNRVDNSSAGGVVSTLDLVTGCAAGRLRDKRGRIFDAHPDTGYDLRDFTMPRIDEIVALARRTQESFPYYRLLGQDIAMTVDGPVLVEINAYPDLAGNERSSGPFLCNMETLREFDRYDLLTRSMRRLLARDLERARKRF